jgi:hypothetical protein
MLERKILKILLLKVEGGIAQWYNIGLWAG